MSDEDNEERLISEEPEFAMMLEHGVSMASHILDEVDEENLDKSSVTLGCDFVLDLIDYCVQMACRYEGFEENMEELILMYNQQVKSQIKFGSRTKH